MRAPCRRRRGPGSRSPSRPSPLPTTVAQDARRTGHRHCQAVAQVSTEPTTRSPFSTAVSPRCRRADRHRCRRRRPGCHRAASSPVTPRPSTQAARRAGTSPSGDHRRPVMSPSRPSSPVSSPPSITAGDRRVHHRLRLRRGSRRGWLPPSSSVSRPTLTSASFPSSPYPRRQRRREQSRHRRRRGRYRELRRLHHHQEGHRANRRHFDRKPDWYWSSASIAASTVIFLDHH